MNETKNKILDVLAVIGKDLILIYFSWRIGTSQSALTYSKLTIEILEQGVKYIQS